MALGWTLGMRCRSWTTQAEVALSSRSGLCRSWRHLKPANNHRKAPSWGPSPHCDTPPSVGNSAELRVFRVARRAIWQFCRENTLLHEGQVITSEAQL